jgi:integrase
MRLGECADLSADCLRHLGPEQWALRVPLGKLHNERWIPVDDDIREILARILSLNSPSLDATPSGLLLPQPSKRISVRRALQRALTRAARRAHCSAHITPHQLRHTYATEMLRADVSLPAIKINMTMRYVQVSQKDLQEQYHQARQKMTQLHAIPKLQSSKIKDTEIRAGIPGICHSLTQANHLMEMYRRQLTDQHIRRKLERLANRLVKISTELHQLGDATI